MKNINNKSTIYGLGILFVLALGMLALAPEKAKAQTDGYVTPYNNTTWGNVTPNYNYGNIINPAPNPVPILSYANPNSANSVVGNMAIILTGANFVPGSMAKWDDVFRPTSYTNSSQLTVVLYASDLTGTGSHVMSVFNPIPGGGVSNGIIFTVAVGQNGGSPIPNSSASAKKSTSSIATEAVKKSAIESIVGTGGLTANALFGAGNFLPSSLIQWILFAILVLLIVILARRAFGANKKYYSTPMKHD